jgi:hypothetical protein
VTPGLGGEIDPLRLMKRRGSLVSSPTAVSSHQPLPAEMKSGGHLPKQKQQATPTVFEEPDANSLLDNFGF